MKVDQMVAFSHDLLMPVSVIQGSTDVIRRYLKMGNLNGIDLGQYLSNLERSCAHLSRLIRNLIDHGTAQDQIFMPQACDMSELVQEIVESVHLNFPELSFKVDAPEACLIVCDSEKVSRVMLNLISNTIKYVGKDSEISIVLQENDGEVVLRYSDNGQINEDLAGKMFTPFFSGSESGTGLGLAIVQDFMKLHGGTVEYDLSDKCFVLRFPVREVGVLNQRREGVVIEAIKNIELAGLM